MNVEGDRLRILIVDDEEQIRFVARAFLEQEGHAVEDTPGGESALECFAPGKFDLVLTDFMMPEMRGDQLIAELRKIAPEQKVLVMSGFIASRNGTQERVLPKPFSRRELLEAIQEVMSQQPPS